MSTEPTEQSNLRDRTIDFDNKQELIREAEESEGIELKWKNLTVEVVVGDRRKKFHKTILNNVSGYSRQGEVLAIMGPSGAGKTTLMAMLANRLEASSTQKLKGEILMNNEAYDSARFSNNAAFIMQTDILLETMTVFECLQFAARMRLKSSEEAKEERVEEIIRKLELTHCENTYVGGQFVKGVSGGERKRTCIAVELVSNPNLILLDEPTSGLDSFTATILISLLRNLAKNDNKNIVFTIHQPGSDIVQMFDRLLLLKNGQEVYEGPSAAIIEYMKNCGITIPLSSNPSDVFMEELQKADEETQFNAANYQNQQEGDLLRKLEHEINFSGELTIREYSNDFSYEFKLIALRTLVNFKRNPYLLYGKILQLIFLYVFYGTVWWQCAKVPSCIGLSRTDCKELIQTSTENTVGLLFSLVTGVTFSIESAMTLTFPAERAIFLKEHNSNSYRLISYFFGKVCADLPFTLLFPVLLALGTFITGDLRWGPSGSGFFTCIVILIAIALVASGLGLMNGAMFSNVKVAIAVTPALLLPFMLFSGLYENLDSIPLWIGWIEYISFIRYGFEGLIENEFNGLTVQTDYGVPLNLEKIVTTNFSFSLDTWVCIVILFGLAAGFYILALLCLRSKARKIAV